MIGNKKGITMTILIIYIVVAVAIMSVVISTYLNSKGIKETSKSVFQARIQDYLDQFTVSKNYYILQGEFDSNLFLSNNDVDAYGRTMNDYIPSITIADKKFLYISGGVLCYYNLPATDVRVGYLEEIGIQPPILYVDYGLVRGEDLQYGGITTTVDNDGVIQLDGKVTGGGSATIKISTQLLGSSTPGAMNWGDQTIIDSGQAVSLVVEPISGTLTGTKDTEANQFNILTRIADPVEGTVAGEKIMMLTNNPSYRYPADGSFEVLPEKIVAVYLYIKGNANFTEYKFKINLLKQNLNVSQNVNNEDIQNEIEPEQAIFQMIPGNQKEASNGFKVAIQNDGSILLDNKPNGNIFIVMSGPKIGIETTSNNIPAYVSTITTFAPKDSNIDFSVEVISGTIKYDTGSEFNVTLRQVTGAKISPISTYKQNNGTTANVNIMTLSGDMRDIKGVISNDVRALVLFVKGNVEFDNYVIKPSLVIS